MPRTTRHLITVDAAAKICDCHPRTIRRRIADGTIRAYRVGAQNIRIDQAEVEKLIQPVPVTGTYGGNTPTRARRLLAEALALVDAADDQG